MSDLENLISVLRAGQIGRDERRDLYLAIADAHEEAGQPYANFFRAAAWQLDPQRSWTWYWEARVRLLTEPVRHVILMAHPAILKFQVMECQESTWNTVPATSWLFLNMYSSTPQWKKRCVRGEWETGTWLRPKTCGNLLMHLFSEINSKIIASRAVAAKPRIVARNSVYEVAYEGTH